MFVFECATTSTLSFGEVRGGTRGITLEGRRMFRIVLSPTGFSNFCHNFCLALNAGQNNLAKTSNCVFLSRKSDLSELPSPNFNVALEVFVCECAMTSTLILGEEEGRDNVKGKEVFRIVLSPAGFSNFSHSFCPGGHSITKHTGGGLARRSESKTQTIYPKIAILKKC